MLILIEIWQRDKKKKTQPGVNTFPRKAVHGLPESFGILCRRHQTKVSIADHCSEHHCCQLAFPQFWCCSQPPQSFKWCPVSKIHQSRPPHCVHCGCFCLWTSQHGHPDSSVQPHPSSNNYRLGCDHPLKSSFLTWLPTTLLLVHQPRPKQTPHLLPHDCVFIVLKNHWSPEICLSRSDLSVNSVDR